MTNRGEASRKATRPAGTVSAKRAPSTSVSASRQRAINGGVMAIRTVAFLFLAAIFSPQPVRSSEAAEHNITGILDSLLVGYDKRIRPNYDGAAVEVGVSLYVLDISSISEENMDFTLDFYFRQYWTDPRLSFEWKPRFGFISVGSEYGKNIWQPDTFFTNEKQSYAHSITTSNEFLRISPIGEITRSIRITVTASCPMNLQYFPMDRQLCDLSLESFGYTMRDIRYKWKQGPNSVGLSYGIITQPQFRIIGYRQKEIDINLTTGNYSRLACDFLFERSLGYYIMQIYIPSALIVVMSSATFWLNRNLAPTRIALGAITILTMTALMSSTNAYLPKVSYIKASDLYLGICFIMVIAAFLEYVTVCYMLKRLQTRKNRYLAIQKLADEKKPTSERKPAGEGAVVHKQAEVRFKVFESKITTDNNGTGSAAVDEESGEPMLPGTKADKLYGVSPSDLDKYSRIVFPIFFVCFNLMYWIIYLHITGTRTNDLILLVEDS